MPQPCVCVCNPVGSVARNDVEQPECQAAEKMHSAKKSSGVGTNDAGFKR